MVANVCDSMERVPALLLLAAVGFVPNRPPLVIKSTLPARWLLDAKICSSFPRAVPLHKTSNYSKDDEQSKCQYRYASEEIFRLDWYRYL